MDKKRAKKYYLSLSTKIESEKLPLIVAPGLNKVNKTLKKYLRLRISVWTLKELVHMQLNDFNIYLANMGNVDLFSGYYGPF